MSVSTVSKITGVPNVNVEDKYVRTTRFASVSSNSGSITLPPNATVILDDFGGAGIDAIVSQIDGTSLRPSFSNAYNGAAIVTTSFNGSGAYVLSGNPSFPVAVVYRVQQRLEDFDSLASDIIGEATYSTFVKTTGDTMTGDLTLPLAKFTNTLDGSFLSAGWSATNFQYEITNPVHALALIAPVGNQIRVGSGTTYFFLDSTSFQLSTNSGGVLLGDAAGANSIDVNASGAINITANPTSTYTLMGNAGDLKFGANGGDFNIINNIYGSSQFIAYNDGRVYIQSLNSQPIRLINSGTSRAVVTNGFEITDPESNIVATLFGLANENIAFGKNAFGGGVSGANNVAIGKDIFSHGGLMDGSNNLGIGARVMNGNALQMAATGNVGIGQDVLSNLIDGESNTAIGSFALNTCTTGDTNLALGVSSLRNLTSGSGNTAIGPSAGFFTTTGTNNLFLSASAGLYNTTGSGNTYIGESAGSSINGYGNIAIGAGALTGAAGATASSNVVVGINLFPSISTGNNNIALAIGGGGAGVLTSGSKNIVIGWGSDIQNGSSDNQISIGNSIYGTGIATGDGANVSNSFIGIGLRAPTARLHLRAGSATASTAPLKITAGALLTTPEAGAIEFNGNNLFLTPTAFRHNFIMNNLGFSGGQTIFGGTGASENLTLSSTSSATKGKIFFGQAASTAYDGVNDRFGIGQSTPTAALHLKAGTSTAATAPLKFTSGTVLTTPESGSVEYDGTEFYVTPSSAVRYAVDKVLKGSATLDFPSTAAGTSSDLTITVTGAADGDVVALGVPNASANANSNFTARVSAANTVNVRFNNYSLAAINPASGTFKVNVSK